MSHLGHGGDKFNKTDKFGNPIPYTGGNIGGHGHKTRTGGVHTTRGNTGAHGAKIGEEHGTGAVNHGDKGHDQVGNIGGHGHETHTAGAHAIKGNTDACGAKIGGEHGTDAVNHGNENHGQGENIGEHGHKTHTEGAHVTEGNNDVYETQTDGKHGTGAMNHGNKGHGQGGILHQSNNSESNSTDDDGQDGKKSIMNKIKEKLPGENKPSTGDQDAYAHGHGATTTPNGGATTTQEANEGHETDEQSEKKGFMEKIKDKLTGAATTTPHEGYNGSGAVAITHESNAGHETDEQPEKKGFMKKMKDKLTGHH